MLCDLGGTPLQFWQIRSVYSGCYSGNPFVMTILRGFPKMHPKSCAVSTLETSREDIEAYIEGVGQNGDPRWGRVCSQGVVRVT